MTVDLEEHTQQLLCKLRQVFNDGYRPARRTQSYLTTLNNRTKVYSMVNCLGHIFNLRNQQFNDYKFSNFCLFGNFPGLAYDPRDKAADRMFDFIKATGLQLEDCAPDKLIDDFKSWKIALYFEDNHYHRDFHYLLEEQPQLWSSKIGFEPCVEHIYTKNPPMTYRNLVDNDAPIYQLYGTYKITNPNACINNPYLRKLKINTDKGLKFHEINRQYVIEDGRKNSIENIIEELFLG